MSKNYKSIIFLLLIIITSTKCFATTSRTYDFNKTSDLTNYFNPDLDSHFTNNDYAGLNFTGSVTTTGHEDVWTTKKGFITTGTGDSFEISGYFYNMDLFGYGSLGLSNTDSNSGDFLGRASPDTGIGFVFHGGGGYLVNDGNYTEVLWPPDLDDSSWYKFTLIVENIGSNKFSVTTHVYKADSMGNTLSLKSVENTEFTNPTLASASKIYSYFGANSVRFSYIDNIKIQLTNATFEESGKPLVTTTTATNIGASSADVGGEVTNEMGNTVTSRGVCYSTTANPTISGTCTSNGSGLGVFNSNLTSLSQGTLYYYRAFATNSNGTNYGTEKTFTTISTNTDPQNNVGSSGTSKKISKPKCTNPEPPKTTWIKSIQSQKDGKKGLLLKWSQLGANKITIMIDDGSGNYPYKISKTKNDGNEFLPNVTSNQKIKLLPYNGCKIGEESPEISANLYPKGYFLNR